VNEHVVVVVVVWWWWLFVSTLSLASLDAHSTHVQCARTVSSVNEHVVVVVVVVVVCQHPVFSFTRCTQHSCAMCKNSFICE